MNNLFLDTEFNGFGGKLISMGIVGDDGREFYEVIHFNDFLLDPWVTDNVIPKLNKPSIDLNLFYGMLQNYLDCYYPVFNVVANWPTDFELFCNTICFNHNGNLGRLMRIPTFSMEFYPYHIPGGTHNAIEDARLLKYHYANNKLNT